MADSAALAPSLSYDFVEAGKAVIRFLHERIGFDLWMVTRTEGDDWIVLQAEDHGYGVEKNSVFRWADSFCSHMVKGHRPRVAPDSKAVAVYADAPIGRQVRIESYIGVPITGRDGALFGTLCAIHPSPKSEAIHSELPLIELLGTMLSGILRAELRAIEKERGLERARSEAETDALTQLCNRRGWDRLLALEEERCSRYGHNACVIMMDLDDLKEANDSGGHEAGDRLLRTAAEAIRRAVREADVVARLGGDEFAVLCVECDAAEAGAVIRRMQRELNDAGVRASSGSAMRVPGTGLDCAVREADAAMYADKSTRKRLVARALSASQDRPPVCAASVSA